MGQSSVVGIPLAYVRSWALSPPKQNKVEYHWDSFLASAIQGLYSAFGEWPRAYGARVGEGTILWGASPFFQQKCFLFVTRIRFIEEFK